MKKLLVDDVFENIERFTSNLEKIKILSERMESVCSFMHDLVLYK